MFAEAIRRRRLEVEGTWVAPTTGGSAVSNPTLRVVSERAISEPRNPYE